MATGRVKWFNAEKGYGFITPHDGSADVFVASASIKTPGLRSLSDDQFVEFDTVSGPKGLQAENVTPRD